MPPEDGAPAEGTDAGFKIPAARPPLRLRPEGFRKPFGSDFYPRVNEFAYKVTAFNGLLYGLYNVSHWFSPERQWMGFLHLPLLLLSAYALILPRLAGRLAREGGGAAAA